MTVKTSSSPRPSPELVRWPKRSTASADERTSEAICSGPRVDGHAQARQAHYGSGVHDAVK
jgi:hypothetical protein